MTLKKLLILWHEYRKFNGLDDTKEESKVTIDKIF
jgi:hypothetical protein